MTVSTEARGSARESSLGPPGAPQRVGPRHDDAIADAIEPAGADEAVRCVVLRGAGEHFSAGDDLQAAIAADSARGRRRSRASSA